MGKNKARYIYECGGVRDNDTMTPSFACVYVYSLYFCVCALLNDRLPKYDSVPRRHDGAVGR